jgi:outer membrane protein assembly factor BamD
MPVRRPILVFLSCVLSFGGVLAQTAGPSTFEEQAAAGRSLGQPVGDERSEFALAEDYYQSGASSQALAAYRRFLKLYPASSKASVAQFRIAELLETAGNPGKAFDAYQTLVTKYPDTPEFEQAVARQVLIANEFLTSQRFNLLGLVLMPGPERAQSMFEAILKNAPFSKHAAVSQFNLGLAFEKQGKVAEARAAYQRVLDKYPSSTVADDALYQIAYIYMRQGLSGKSEDLSALVLAKETFEDFLLQFPNSEKVAQARDNLRTIGDREAGDLMAIARYYDWSKNFRAAAIYYNDVIRRQPNSADAEEARSRVQVLRNDLGEDALRVGAERAESGEKAALRRRLQAQVETSALSDYAGPARRELVPDELPVARAPRLRTGVRDLQPLPALEPALPTE